MTNHTRATPGGSLWGWNIKFQPLLIFVNDMNRSRLNVLICLLQILWMHAAVAQISMRAKAQLFYEIERSKDSWSEGFSSLTEGTSGDYESHRSNGAQDKAFVVRSGNKETQLVWKTGPLHLRTSADSIRCVWVCGFGNNLAREYFRVVFNGQRQFQFATISEPSWSVTGTQGGRLGFTAVYQNHNKANFGYMVLVLPHGGLNEGDTATIRVESLPSTKETWYRTFGYNDVLKHLLRNEAKQIFTEVKFVNLGDATITAYSSARRSGSVVSLLSNKKELGHSVFRSDENLATAQFDLPRKTQTEQTEYVLVSAGTAIDTIWLKSIQEQRAKAFLEEELEFDKYVFPRGAFPSVHWKRPAMVANEIGNVPLTVSYFNGAMQPVEEATETGRYGAVVQGVLASGFVVQRFVTLYCSPVEMDDYSTYVPITLTQHPAFNISSRSWDRYVQNVKRFSFGSLLMYPAHSGDAAIFLSGLSELDTASANYDTPRIRDRQWWITLKARRSRAIKKINPLKIPMHIDNPSGRLLAQSKQPDGMYSMGDLETIRKLCRLSTEKIGEPTVTLIAHDGKIVFEEAVGTNPDGTSITRDTPLWMASITKLLTGVLFMQFVDQGLVDLDAPVEQFLPELRTNDKQKITVRHLFTHTSGLSWVGEWGSDWEPSLENRLAYALPYAHIGERFEYHRIGYALAGKIMERITGIAVPYLFREYIFGPLNLKNAYSDNTYGGLYCTAEELAAVAQMLLQKGRYGSTKLFSEEAFNKMLPADVPVTSRVLGRKWGIGTSILSGNGLSETTYGHEAASGAILRIDPQRELIIVSARNGIGKNHEEYERFVRELIELSTKPFRTLK